MYPEASDMSFQGMMTVPRTAVIIPPALKDILFGARLYRHELRERSFWEADHKHIRCRVQGTGCKVRVFRFEVERFDSRVLEFKVWGLEFRVKGLSLRVKGKGFTVWGFG